MHSDDAFVRRIFFEGEKKFEHVPPLFLSPISINALLYHYSPVDERTHRTFRNSRSHQCLSYDRRFSACVQIECSRSVHSILGSALPFAVVVFHEQREKRGEKRERERMGEIFKRSYSNCMWTVYA